VLKEGKQGFQKGGKPRIQGDYMKSIGARPACGGKGRRHGEKSLILDGGDLGRGRNPENHRGQEGKRQIECENVKLQSRNDV